MNPTKFPVIYQATVAAVVIFLLLMFLINQGVIPLDVSGLLTYYSFQVFTVLLASVLGGILIGMFIATRALSSQGFTPFEVSMLKLKDDIHNLEKVLATAFNQRRKMLRNSFRLFGGSKLLERAGIDPEERPENLTLESFCVLAKILSENKC